MSRKKPRHRHAAFAAVFSRALLLLFLCLNPAPQAARAAEPAVVAVGLSKTPSALPVLRMMEAKTLGDGVELRPTLWTAPEQLIAMAQGGTMHLFTLPVTVAARLRARGVDVKLTNVGTWGGIFLVTADPDLREWADLRGKTLFMPARTSPPDALTRYFLARAGLDPDRDLELKRTSVAETAQLLRAGLIDSAVLTEPQATAALSGNAALRVVFDFEAEWRGANGGDAGIPTIGFGGMAAFLDADPAFVRRFEDAYREATDWVLAHPEEAGALAEKHLGVRADLIARAVPRLGLRYRRADEAAAEIADFYRRLYGGLPGDLAEAIPDEALYWR